MQLECGSLNEDGHNIAVGPVFSKAEITTALPQKTSTNPVNVQQSVRMRFLAKPFRGWFSAFYTRDVETEASQYLDVSEGPRKLERTTLPCSTCTLCGDCSHIRSQCAIFHRTLKLHFCRFCGTMLIANKANGVCCEKQSSSGRVVSFRRGHTGRVSRDI